MNILATEDEVLDALHDVVDPELGINVVDLGLVYGVVVDDDNVAVLDMTLTSAACPLTDVIEDQTRAALDGIVDDFRMNWVWMPPVGSGPDHRRRPRDAARPGLQRLTQPRLRRLTRPICCPSSNPPPFILQADRGNGSGSGRGVL